NRFLLVSATRMRKIFIIDTLNKQTRELNLNLGGYAPNGLYFSTKDSILFVAANENHLLGEEGNGRILRYKMKINLKSAKLLQEKSIGRFLDGISSFNDKIVVSDWRGVGDDGVLYSLDRITLELLMNYEFLLPGLADFDYSEHKNLLVLPDLLKGKIRGFEF
ncbi:hypothetical protein N9N67_09380, partial [Bacteriovoracaceae bacterium]|nr:hypothetical protein [Bacteriovoracaceae bacterium]